MFLSVGDNRLVLDLDHNSQAEELRSELLGLPEGGAVIVQEVFPSLDDAWLPGPEGHYYSEFIVSMVLDGDVTPTARPSVSRLEQQTVLPIAGLDATEQTGGRSCRNYPPGSEWLFVKLYCPRNLEDDVICESMLTFADNATASGLADSWFYVRYSDPDAHIRLRFHGSPDRLSGQLFGHVCDWATRLMTDGLCLKFVFDTYERELERYGGLAGMDAAESLFFVDSRHAAAILRSYRAKKFTHDHVTLVTASIDLLLAGIGLDPDQRLRWYRSQATPGRAEAGSEYRQRKSVLRLLLGKADSFANEPGGAEIAEFFDARRGALAAAANQLRDLSGRGELGQALDALYASFVHLHVNRMGGIAVSWEQRMLSLLLRTREGLQKSPVSRR